MVISLIHEVRLFSLIDETPLFDDDVTAASLCLVSLACKSISEDKTQYQPASISFFVLHLGQ